MCSGKIIAFVVAVDLSALVVLAMSAPQGVRGRADVLLLLIGLAAAAGHRPIRVPGVKAELTPTHPFVFVALAALGPVGAALVGVAGVVGAMTGRERLPTPIRVAFNLGAVVLSAASAAGIFLAMGGRPGQAVASLSVPLTGAAAAYYLVNTGLVSAAIALEHRRSLFSTWRTSFLWTGISYLAGVALSVALLALADTIAIWALLFGVPFCWLLRVFYRERAQAAAATKVREALHGAGRPGGPAPA